MEKSVPRRTTEIFYDLTTEEANEIIEEIMQIMKKHEVTVGDAKHLLEFTIYAIKREVKIK